MQKKRLNWKYKVNFKIYDATAWLTNNCNTHIAQYNNDDDDNNNNNNNYNQICGHFHIYKVLRPENLSHIFFLLLV